MKLVMPEPLSPALSRKRARETGSRFSSIMLIVGGGKHGYERLSWRDVEMQFWRCAQQYGGFADEHGDD